MGASSSRSTQREGAVPLSDLCVFLQTDKTTPEVTENHNLPNTIQILFRLLVLMHYMLWELDAPSLYVLLVVGVL